MVHDYLRAIGFRSIKQNKEVDFLVHDILEHPDRQYSAVDEDGNEFVEMVKEYDESYGISVCGHYDDYQMFQIEYYYPYFVGTGMSVQHYLDIEKHNGKDSYAGICDDPKVGVSLIFYLQNVTKYLSMRRKGVYHYDGLSVGLSALCTSARILLPIQKNDKEVEKRRISSQNRNNLIAAARNGDPDAIESLTIEDMDTYSMISRKIMTSDVFTLVDTSFIPCSVESDQYTIVGEIVDIFSTKNKYTSEEVLIVTVDCNDLIFDVCVNREDILGEPAIGRRFKGCIWMQGNIAF